MNRDDLRHFFLRVLAWFLIGLGVGAITATARLTGEARHG